MTISLLRSGIGIWSEIDKWLIKNTPKKRLAKPLSMLNPKAGVLKRQVIAAMPEAGCIALTRMVIAVAVNFVLPASEAHPKNPAITPDRSGAWSITARAGRLGIIRRFYDDNI